VFRFAGGYAGGCLGRGFGGLLGIEICRLQRRRSGLAGGFGGGFLAALHALAHPFSHKGF
jgi:hypothetical protein